ncbi:MAG: glycosyltransferase family 2 protein [Magnetococcales bacterium]|nr:glycosyltransferase family 2 protein [Magnetococcales bacterium]
MIVEHDISVVIPVYNGADHVLATLESVACQTVKPLEVIVVDDGSTDQTCAIVEVFAKDNPGLNVRLIRSAHQGPGATRNVGIAAARGHWLAFLDSDDLWYPEKLSKISEYREKHRDVNFFCHNEIHRRFDKSIGILDFGAGFRHDESLPVQLFKNNFFSTSAIVCEKRLVVDAGMFDVTLPNAQDYELWLRMSPGIRVLFVKDILGEYVDRSGNITSKKLLRRYWNVLRVLSRHRYKVTLMVYMVTVMRLSVSYIYRGTIRKVIETATKAR